MVSNTLIRTTVRHRFITDYDVIDTGHNESRHYLFTRVLR